MLPPPAPPPLVPPAWWIGTLLVVLPPGAGVLLRVALSRLGRRSRPAALAALLASVVTAAVALEPCALPVSVDDVTWIVSLAALGAFLARGGHWPSPAFLARCLAGSALVLLGLEGGARVLSPPLFPTSGPVNDRFLRVFDNTPRYGMAYVGLANATQARACGVAFPERAPDEYRDRLAAAVSSGGVSALHVGDSMVEAQAVGGATGQGSFVARLNRLVPGTAHVNGGVSGTGIDLQSLLVEQWTARERYAALVLHVFLVNDLMYMGTRYPCCDDGPVPSTPADAKGACGADRYPSCWRQWLAGDQGAYVLRNAAPASALARAVNARLLRMRAAAIDGRLSEPEQWQALEHSLATIRDTTTRRGVPLAVVLLPERGALDASVATCPGCHDLGPAWLNARLRFLDVAARLGLTVWDPFDVLAARARVEDPRAWFVPSPPYPPDDVHFGERGHELVAAWLAERLRAWPPVGDALAATPTAP